MLIKSAAHKHKYTQRFKGALVGGYIIYYLKLIKDMTIKIPIYNHSNLPKSDGIFIPMTPI